MKTFLIDLQSKTGGDSTLFYEYKFKINMIVFHLLDAMLIFPPLLLLLSICPVHMH